MNKLRIGFAAELLPDHPPGWPEGTRSYAVGIARETVNLLVQYNVAPPLTDEPTLADVLSSMLIAARSVDNAHDFEDWCALHHTVPDAANSEAYNVACEHREMVNALFTPDEREMLEATYQ